MVFHFEVKLIVETKKAPACRIDEFQLATLIRILKTRNKELFNILNHYYDSVVEYNDAQR